jgi:hypothetical protein
VLTPLRVAGWLAVVLVALCAATNAVAFVGAARARRRTPACPAGDEDVPRWPARALARADQFVRESAAMVLVTLAAPFALRPAYGHGGPVRRRPRVVLLVPGYGQPRGSLFCLARRLAADDWDAIVPVRHGPGGTLEERARRLGRAIEDARRTTRAQTVDVVAYGLGGLVARAWVRLRGAESGILRLVTLGTPHQGTQAMPWLAPEAMRCGSDALRRLGEDDPVPALLECTAVYSIDDALVVPAGNGYYAGVFNVEMRGVGHATLLFSRRAHALVRENLGAPDATDTLARRARVDR